MILVVHMFILRINIQLRVDGGIDVQDTNNRRKQSITDVKRNVQQFMVDGVPMVTGKDGVVVQRPVEVVHSLHGD